ncbi:MAG TPA: VOC family protein [Patescibacteria group bacterium]|nr:VOC family protein [Patescibacteria group bacterium]
MPRVMHFDLYADKPERAIKFYTDTFGWKFDKWSDPSYPSDYWQIITGDETLPGINGGLSPRTNVPRNTLTIVVPSVDTFIGKVVKNGGSIVIAKTAIRKVGWFSVFRDPEGEYVGMLETDMEAK